MPYDYKIADQVLGETDKKRLLCLFLNSLPGSASSVDWEKATAEFGSASVASMKVSHAVALKKIADAGGKDAGTILATPSKTGRKRKAGAGDGESTSTKKKAGGKGKKGRVALEDDDTAVTAKAEPEE